MPNTRITHPRIIKLKDLRQRTRMPRDKFMIGFTNQEWKKTINGLTINNWGFLPKGPGILVMPFQEGGIDFVGVPQCGPGEAPWFNNDGIFTCIPAEDPVKHLVDYDVVEKYDCKDLVKVNKQGRLVGCPGKCRAGRTCKPQVSRTKPFFYYLHCQCS